MRVSSRTLQSIYAAIAVIALLGTWANNLAYLNLGPIGGTLQFWRETLANPASRSITVDISFLFLAAAVWMTLEARRLRIRYVWVYIVLGLLVAVSVTFPLFMISRERALNPGTPGREAGAMNGRDAVGLLALASVFLVYAVATLRA